MVTSFPRLRSSSATSTPMNPPPTMTILSQALRYSSALSKYSLSLGTMRTPGRSAPFSHPGILGTEPSASTSFSNSISLPPAVLQDLCSREMDTTSSTTSSTPALARTSSGMTF